MSLTRLIAVSLVHYWRMHAAVACGVIAGTAVLTGALLVGDSMRGSLKDLTYERLGPIDEVLTSQRFFREQLAEDLAEQAQFEKHFSSAVPVILLQGSVRRAKSDSNDKEPAETINRVNLIGCDRRFWQLGSGPERDLTRKQIVLNKPLARELDVLEGQEVTVRLAPVAAVHSESLLGRTDASPEVLRLTVHAIIPADATQLGRFTLHPSQQAPLSAYLSLSALQRTLQLDEPKQVNTVLVSGKTVRTEPSEQAHQAIAGLLRPTLEDFGLRVERIERGELSYFNITTDRMILDEAIEKEIVRTLKGEKLQPVLTYLANKIDVKPPDPDVPAADQRSGIPYSMIAAVDFVPSPPWGPLPDRQGTPIGPLDDSDGGRPKIVLNDWAADDLGVAPGDSIFVSYFQPESTHEQGESHTEEFELAAIARLEGPAADPDFTPTVPNVTDADSIRRWKAPFQPFHWGWLRMSGEKGQPGNEDDDYWQAHKATPKAFVSLATGHRLWGSRFGKTTSIRVQPTAGMTVETLRARLRLDPAALGFVFQPVKQQGLDASVGTMSGLMSFSGLFVAFSFFIIAAALMLVMLLFRLGIDSRAAELGLLAAVGFNRRRVVRLLAAEGLVVSAVGGLIGVPGGVGYAALMLYGLHTRWQGAIATPFVRLHIEWPSLAIGLLSGVLVGFLAVFWAIWRTRNIPPQRLLAGQTEQISPRLGTRSRWAVRVALLMVVGAIGLGLAAMGLSEGARAGAFFGAGSMALTAVLATVWACLRAGSTGAAVTVGRRNLLRLALRNAGRNPGRSTLTVGLVASACFLIVAVSAFRIDPAQKTPTPGSGNGGFALVSQADQPIHDDLNSESGLKRLKFSKEDRDLLEETRTFAWRVNRGDDASCLNLYKPKQPRILGVSKDFIQRGERFEDGGFAWAATAADDDQQQQNPWRLLDKELKSGKDKLPVVPVVIDMNTAMYSLHLWKGVGSTYDVTDGYGQPVHLEVVGLLSNSIFQGDLLIGERAFLKHFPDVSGYGFFLTESSPEQTQDVIGALRRTLGDRGVSVETSGRRLADFLAVQNTYLLTFQSLGGLGLLLGTFGLAAVQLRNVLERRGELALLRAAGFRRATLGWLVMIENGLLLCVGLAAGVGTAMVAVLPHLFSQGASIPWTDLGVTLATVLAVGLAAGMLAVRAALAAPLLGTLREEH